MNGRSGLAWRSALGLGACKARSVLAAFLGCAVAIVAWHFVVSTVFWRPTGYQDHPVLGRIYRPGVYVHGVEGFSVSRINSLGMRGPELGRKRAASERILFLGDSFTEAFQVPLDRTFVALTPWLLESRGIDAETVNGGRSGAGPATYLYDAEWYTSNVHPDTVVIQLSGGDFEGLTDTKSNFYLAPSGSGYEPRLNTGFHSANEIAQRYPIVRVALEWPLLRLGAENVRRVLQLGERTPGGSQAADREQIEWVIGAFAEAYDDPVILFLPSVDYEKDPSERGDVESAVRDSAQRHGLRFVDVRSQMAAAFTDDRMPSHGFANTVIPSEGHLNETGHQIVARALADVLATKVTR